MHCSWSTRSSRWALAPFLWGLVLGLVLMPVGRAAAAAGAAAPEAATSRVLIKFRNSSALPRIASVQQVVPRDRVQALAVRRATPMRYLRTMYNGTHTVHLGRFVKGAELSAIVARLAADPEVEWVQPDRIKRVQAMPNDPRAGVVNGDPNGQFTQQWYLFTPTSTLVSSIDAVRAWDYSRGSANVRVAVIDTGVLYRHPDLGMVVDSSGKALGGKLLPGFDMVGSDTSTPTYTFYIANDGDGADADATDPGDWINTADQSNSIFAGVTGGCPIQPSSWHGTKVAGVVGASTNDGIGIAGVGWDTPVLPVRALGKCIGFDSDIVDAMAWAAGIDINSPPVPPLSTGTITPDPSHSGKFPINPYPARIINLSLGSANACSLIYQDIISYLTTQKGVVIVAAAGNGDASDGSGAGGKVREPANCPGVIAVSALRFAGTKVGFSDLGPEVAISAPGGNCVNAAPPCLYSIVSTGNSGTEAASESGMNYVDGNQADSTYSGQTIFGGGEFGTSFSAPMVSGVVALMLTINPALTPTDVLHLLQSSARPFPSMPNGSTVLACPAPPAIVTVPTSGECYCPPPTVAATPTSAASGGLCGAGMLDAYQAVLAAWTFGGNAGAPPLLPDPTTVTVSPPVIPPLPPPAPAASAGSGGGGSTSPWWILAILAASVMRARTAPKAMPYTRLRERSSSHRP
jgi:serine protease